MATSSTISKDALHNALECARFDRRADILKALHDLPDPGEAHGDPDHRWLWAELQYRRGRYAQTLVEFERLSAHSQSVALAPWMRFMAHLRCAYASFRLGDSERSGRELQKADALLAAHRELQHFEADSEALHAHLLEVEGSCELARARFLSAHRLARAGKRPGRSATTASDIGRLHADLGRIADALEWQHRALDHLKDKPDDYIQRMIRLRIARLDIAMRRLDVADRSLGEIRVACADDLTPEALIGSLVALTELQMVRGRGTASFKTGSALLDEAASVAARFELRPAQARILRDRTRLHLTLDHEKHRLTAARRCLTEAIRIALTLTPTPGLKLQHLAEDMVGFPALIPPERSQSYGAHVQATLKRYRSSLRPRTHGIRPHRDQRQRRYFELLDVVQEYLLPPASPVRALVELGDHRFQINLDSLHVTRNGRLVKRYPYYMAKVLRRLAAAPGPLSTSELARAAATTELCVRQVYSMIRKYEPHLLIKSREKPPRYVLERAEYREGFRAES